LDSSSEYVDILPRLGLTLNEAKIFFALSRNGISTVKAAANSSGVAREVVYRIMPKLHRKGLVEEIITSPKAFKPIPLKDAYSLLLQRKEEENQILREKVKATLQNQQTVTAPNVENLLIVLPPSRKDSRWKHEWRTAQKSVDMIILFNKFVQWAQSTAELCIDCSLKRNVKMRIITEKQTQDAITTSHRFSHPLTAKLAYVKLKYVAKLPLTEMTVFDKKTVHVSIQKENRIENMRWLCTNNPLIVEIANNYFENLWSTAKQEMQTKVSETDLQQPLQASH